MLPDTPTNDGCGDDFMLREYQRLYELSRVSLGNSEQRVTFFLTLSSAVAGILFFFMGRTSQLAPHRAVSAAVSALIVLLVYGMTTLNRIVWGSEQRLYYERLMKEIRRYFAQRDPRIAPYLELQDSLLNRPVGQSRLAAAVLQIHRGRLTDFLILSNGLICGATTVIVLSSAGWLQIHAIIVAIIVMLTTMLLFYWYYGRIRKNMPIF
jgi:VIT1/CCC1 family predicted Fe2+/Mn2+ transporter